MKLLTIKAPTRLLAFAPLSVLAARFNRRSGIGKIVKVSDFSLISFKPPANESREIHD